MKKIFTISVFTEHGIGLLNRITIIFTRRRLNIESITGSESEVGGIYRYTLVVNALQEEVEKLVVQIEKIVEVFKAFWHSEEEIIWQEIALYKIRNGNVSSARFEKIIHTHHARVVTIDKEFLVLEKTGHKRETQLLFEELEHFGVLEFARSGNVAVTRPMKELSAYLKEIEILTN